MKKLLLLLLSMLMLVLLVVGCAATKESVVSTVPPWWIKTIPLPQDIVIVSPTNTNVPDDIKKLSGVFGGRWSYAKYCTILVVEQLRQDEADVVYGWNNGARANWRRETVPIKRWGHEIRLYLDAQSAHSNRGLEFRLKGDTLYGDLTFQIQSGIITNRVIMERLPVEAVKAIKKGG